MNRFGGPRWSELKRNPEFWLNDYWVGRFPDRDALYELLTGAAFAHALNFSPESPTIFDSSTTVCGA